MSDSARYSNAERHLLKALAIARAQPGDPRWLPTSLYYLGDLYYTFPMLERSGEAESLLEESLARWASLLGEFHPVNAVVLERLGSIAFDRGDEPRARELFARADAIVEASFPANHPIRRARSQGVRLEWGLHPDELLALAAISSDRSSP